MVDVKFLDELCDICMPAMIEGFHSTKRIFPKSNDQVATSVDLQVTDILYNRLILEGFRESEILSEERQPRTTADRTGALWIIDPIDGTKEFISGVPEFALSIAYLESSKPLAAAICNPVANYRVVGESGDGLFVNRNKKEGRAGAASRRLLCSRSEHSKGILTSLSSRLELEPVGSVAYKLALVSGGEARACFNYEPKNSWDIAAGVFLVGLAGGVVTDLAGESLHFDDPLRRFKNGLVGCSSPDDYKALYRTVVECCPL